MMRTILKLAVCGFFGLSGCSSDASGPSGGGDAGSAGMAGSATGAGGLGTGGSVPSTGGSMMGTGGSMTGTGGSMMGTGGSVAGTGGTMIGSGGVMGTGGTSGTGPTYAEAAMWVQDYNTAHPGQDGDVNALTPAQVAADPAAQQLLSLCGPDQRPVIPELAWEYGGGDHAWINPSASALVYCVYIPVNPNTEHWSYDAAADNVTADVYVRFPEDNPCAGMQGADQIAACIGDYTNFEILVDTASLNDGLDVGLNLANASTDLMLILPDGTKVLLHHNV